LTILILMSRFGVWGSVLALTSVLVASPEPARPSLPSRVRVRIDPQHLAAEVDERFLSFAIDTAQVVGGEFWAPPSEAQGLLRTSAVRRYDFARPRLRRLAAALAPAYLRIGGTDADRTAYFEAGRGARWVLTRERWDEVNEFARALDLRLAFTLNAGPGARDGDGNWDPASARALIAYTREKAYPVDVWELGNEVNAYPVIHRMWLSADRYAGDLRQARQLISSVGSGRLAGPASAFWPILGELRPFSRPVLERAGAAVDVVSWHYYPQQSHRCPVATRRASPRMLRPDRLADVDKWAAKVEEAARAAPGATIWLGETGGAQCGGEPGLSDSFADALWWLDELGRVARRGHAVVVRQTLSGSDYGLIDDKTLEPNPSYWASWLWRSLMGRRALAVTTEPEAPALRAYAHCLRGGTPGAIVALLINTGSESVEVTLPGKASLLRLEADGLGSRRVRLNGAPLIDADGNPPALSPVPTDGTISVPPLSIAFALIDDAAAPACLTRGSLARATPSGDTAPAH
jgi:heparanase